MKTLKTLTIITALFAIIISPVWAQVEKELVFSETIHDFGLINEVDGPADHEFVFTNTGSQPIKILNVRASCGCTTPGWTKEEIPAGGKGFVKALYNTTNRPGPFNKSLTVTTTGSTSNYVLYIKGNVNPRPRTIEDDFPTLIGGLRFKNRAFTMGRVLTNQPVTRTFEVYNASEGPITFLDSMLAPDYLKITFLPKTIQPKEKGNISVTYDVLAIKDLGYVTANVRLFTDEKEGAAKIFSMTANVEEYFPPMTPEELEQAPRLIFEEPLHDFGRISQNDVVTTDFIFTNKGKKELNIRKTDSSCGCTVATLGKTTLQPGEAGKISLRFDPKGRRGQQQKSISVFSNDPKAPTQRIMVKAFVE